MKKIIRRILITLISAAGLVAMLLVLAIVFIQTGPGQRFIENTLNENLVWDEGRVRINGISGRVPFNLSVENISIEDGRGPWLSISRARLAWSFSKLFKREIYISELGAGSIELDRLPDTEPREDKPDFNLEDIRWTWPLPALTVERLYLQSLHVSRQILDEDMEFSLEGRIAAHDQGFSVSGLDINRLDKQSSLVSFESRLTRDPYSLDLDLNVTDPGMLGALIPLENWPSSTSLHLTGSGPLNSWQGKLNLDGQEMFHLNLDLEILRDDFYLLEAAGEVFVSPDLLPAGGLDFTTDPLDIHIRAGVDNTRRMVLDDLSMESARLALKSAAIFDPWEMSLSGDLGLSVFDVNPLLMDSGFKSSGALRAQVDFSGPVTALAADSTISLGAVQGHGLTLKQATLESDFRLKPSEALIYAVSGRLEALNFFIEQYPNLPENLEFEFDLSHASENILSLKRLDLKARDLTAALAGQMDLNSMRFDADLTADARNAQQLIPGLGLDSFFSTDLEAFISGGGDIGDFYYFADARFKAREFQADNPALRALAGDSPRLTGSVSFDENLSLRVSGADLQAALFSFTGSGDMHFRDMEMDYQGELLSPSLTLLGEALDMDLSGDLRAEVAALGKIAEPDLTARIFGQELSYEHMEPTDLEALIQTSIKQGLPRGSLIISADQAGKQLDFEAGYQLGENNLKIDDLRAWGLGAEIAGDLDFDFGTGLARGDFQADIPRLDAVGEFLDLDIAGALSSRLSLDKAQAEQSLEFFLDGQSLAFNDLYISGIEASGIIRGLSPQGVLSSELAVSGFSAPGVQIGSLEAGLKGTSGRMGFSANLTGEAAHPLDLNMQGTYISSEEKHEIEVLKLDGAYAHEKFHLDSPAVFSYSPHKTALDGFSLVLGSGLLTAQAALTRDAADVSISLRDLGLASIPVPNLEHVMGEVNFDLNLSGSPQNPFLEAHLRIEGLAPSAHHLEILNPLDFTAKLEFENGMAVLQGSLLEDQTSLAGMDFSLPVSFALEPFNLILPDPFPLSGNLKTSLDIETLGMIFLPPDQLLSGTLDSDFTLAGTLEEPELNGTINIDNGAYEHLDAGIYAGDLRLRARAEQTRLTVTEISATDGLRGRVSGTGFVDLAGDLPWNIETKFNNMRLVNHRLATVIIDQGDLVARGDSRGGGVSGKIVFGPVNISLPDQAPPGVVKLDVTEINTDQGPESVSRPPAKVDYPFSLDLELVFPSRVFVRGRGLDSEWEGSLKVNGDASSPSIHGNINVVRGRLDILDRRFNLEPESNINLDGSFPPDPNVDIFAAYRQRDKIINVRVFGPALEPEIKLSSDPHMPEDEILAWVLFGRDLSNISPFQAITLVNAARQLATGRTGPDMMGQVRDFIGVDDLDITRDPDEGHTQFGLGKYVHERVYIEVKKGTAPGTDAILVDVELTPKISLESNLESDNEGGIGLFWKHDY